MLQLEFTVEPFVEGQPGPHVTAAVAAAERAGGTIEFGPFGSTCGAADDDMPDVIAELVRAAFANGASHVTMHVTKHVTKHVTEHVTEHVAGAPAVAGGEP